MELLLPSPWGTLPLATERDEGQLTSYSATVAERG